MEGQREPVAGRRRGRAPAATPVADGPFRALGPTSAALIGVGGDLARLLDRITRRQGSLTLSQYQLLGLLRATHPEPREPWELGRGLRSGSAHVTMLLDHLERMGMVERRAHGHDRRRRRVHLTEPGREAVERLGAVIRSVEERLLAGAMTADEQRRLGEGAERLRAVLEELSLGDPSFLLTAEPGQPPV